MEKRKRKARISRIISLLLLALMIAVPLLLEKKEDEIRALSAEDVFREQPEYRDISTTLSGAGTLTSEEAVKIELPSGVSVTQYLVSNFDEVKEGDPLAAVERASVMTTIDACQLKLDEIAAEMEGKRNWYSYSIVTEIGWDLKEHQRLRYTAETDEDIHEFIYSPVDGTLTALYVETGDDVHEAMLECGCIAVITFDNGYEYKVTAAKGNVNHIYFDVGDTVKAGAALFYLENVTNDAEIEVLAKTRREYEDIMASLMKMYKDGCVTAPCDGIITGIDEAAAAKLETKLKKAHTVQADIVASNSITIQGTIMPMEIIEDPDKPGELIEYMVIQTANGNIIRITKEEYTEKFDEDTATEYETGKKIILTCDYGSDLKLIIQKISPIQNSPSGDDDYSGGFSSGITGKSTAASSGSNYTIEKSTIMSVIPQHIMTVSISVDELDILQIHTGMEAAITLDAFPGKAYSGIVTAINTVGSNKGGNSKYDVEITIPKDEDMLAGMNVSALITVETIEHVLTVPVKAIAEIGTKTFLYTAFDEKAGELTDPVEIRTGASDGEYTEILSGIGENDTFRYSYNEELDLEAIFGGAAKFNGLPMNFW